MSLLGKIMVKIGLDNSDFKRGIGETENKVSGFSKFFSGIGCQIAATAAAAFSIGAIVNIGLMVKKRDEIAIII